MTIGEIGSIGEFVGALATVATLIYLALQIRANTLATKRQALDDTIDRVIGWAAHVAATPDQLSCWIKGSDGFEQLSVEDQLRFAALNMEIFGAAEASLEAAKHGGVKKETVGAVTGIIAQLSLNRGSWDWWQVNGRHLFAADFSNQVSQIGQRTRAGNQQPPAILPFQLPGGDSKYESI